MKRYRLLLGLFALALAMGCSAGKEPPPPPPAQEPAPPQVELFRSSAIAESRFAGDFTHLAIVNGKPYPDMYFEHFGVNPTIDTEEENLSTFAVDVDTASYSMVRSYLERGHLPEEAAVRVEELVNRFDYAYEAPAEDAFSVQVEAMPSRTRPGYHVLHIGLKGREVRESERKAANLVFVVDVSGSMDMENRLGLVKRALELLVERLDASDSVGIVVYGDRAHTVLEPTYASAHGKATILRAIRRLRPEGSTNAQAGLALGYEMAARHLERGKVNRVILCSDGVANNGITEADAIFETIRAESERGVAISTVGFGMGNYNDVLMERLADIGDGNYAYVDRIQEAQRIFVEELTGTLQVIAKDVKIQVAFDREKVTRYRLLGFENRLLENEDFRDDTVDAGEIGAGHTVTAIYEMKLRDGVDRRGSFATVRVRHESPEGGIATEIAKDAPFSVIRRDYAQASPPAKLATVVAAFAEKLRGSYWVRSVTYDDLLALHREIPEPLCEREEVQELHRLILRAQSLDERGDKFETDLPVTEMDFDRVPVLR